MIVHCINDLDKQMRLATETGQTAKTLNVNVKMLIREMDIIT